MLEYPELLANEQTQKRHDKVRAGEGHVGKLVLGVDELVDLNDAYRENDVEEEAHWHHQFTPIHSSSLNLSRGIIKFWSLQHKKNRTKKKPSRQIY